ncbi:Eco57I restriction-modification methylase domain-containing protein [Mucilaginibacter sp. UYCu711]|uniref:Eco57I restriction-modification methylase domain-containing protein n=1 Tax=Mucilaginibacter sp. UYCu711 TaxID=3156339 RepID=UPI003D1F85A6
MPFFQIGINALNPTGRLGYITVNTFIKSVNGRALRQYFQDEALDLTIINFGGEQVFAERNTYTRICIICYVSIR